MAEESREHRDERELRPYRRFVVALFALAIATLAGFVLRGIVRTLDRLPSSAALHRPELVDVRALRACGEDLERLEARARRAAGDAVAYAPKEVAPEQAWNVMAETLEVERLTIVARCHLEEASPDPVKNDLTTASLALEALLRSYSLLHARYQAEAAVHGAEARRALERASMNLKDRR